MGAAAVSPLAVFVVVSFVVSFVVYITTVCTHGVDRADNVVRPLPPRIIKRCLLISPGGHRKASLNGCIEFR